MSYLTEQNLILEMLVSTEKKNNQSQETQPQKYTLKLG